MKKALLLLLLIFIVWTGAGCFAASLDANTIQGTWYYIYVEKAPWPLSPPTFDVMEFGEGGKLKLESKLKKLRFDGSFVIKGTNVVLTFNIAGKPTPVELELKMALANDHELLTVYGENAEMIFCRKDKLVEDDLTGTWDAISQGKKQSMQLSKDGSYHLTEGNVTGYYRLWRSKRGNEMTASFMVPGEGGFTIVQDYERKGDTLTLIPITEKGPQTDKALTFTLSK